jgi:hypothetical protein
MEAGAQSHGSVYTNRAGSQAEYRFRSQGDPVFLLMFAAQDAINIAQAPTEPVLGAYVCDPYLPLPNTTPTPTTRMLLGSGSVIDIARTPARGASERATIRDFGKEFLTFNAPVCNVTAATWVISYASDFAGRGTNISGQSSISELVPAPGQFLDWEQYQVADWDGFGAEPISEATIAAARDLYGKLPPTYTAPEMAPGPDGTIGFEWVFEAGPVRKLFIDVGPDRVWSAYWRLADGRTGTRPRGPVTSGVGSVIKGLLSGAGI